MMAKGISVDDGYPGIIFVRRPDRVSARFAARDADIAQEISIR